MHTYSRQSGQRHTPADLTDVPAVQVKHRRRRPGSNVKMKIMRQMTICTAVALTAMLAPCALGQSNRPEPAVPQASTVNDRPLARADIRPEPQSRDLIRRAPTNGPSRREIPDEQVILAFDDVSVMDTIEFIVKTTGKVVMPLQPSALKGRKISLINDKPISRAEALDLLFRSFRLNGIGVIEHDDIIIIDTLDNIHRIPNMPVYNANVDIMDRSDVGVIAMKIFALQEAQAEDISEQIETLFQLGEKMTVDTNSNQIVVIGDIGLQQQIQRIIDELDNTFIAEVTRTFRLRYADAGEVSDNIYDLFESDGSSGAGRQQRTPRNRNPRQQTPTVPGVGPGPTVELRVTVSGQNNSLTVQAAPVVMQKIDHLIDTEWDLPRQPGTSKIYTLQYTDPLKVRDLLRDLIGSGGSSSGGSRRAGTPGGAQGRTDVSDQLGGVYQIEAYPDSQSLVVLSKTTESLDYLDHIVTSLDQPSDVALPQVIPLKHANAVDLAQEVNVLMSTGGNVTLNEPESGLTGEGVDSFGSDSANAGGGATGGAQTAGQINFPWQRGQQNEDQTPESSLIGKTRVVPIVRQNALAVLAPPAYREAIFNMITDLDQPGRQVMISAIIAEVELSNDLALGLRVSNSGDILGGGNPDNRIGGNFSTTASETGFLDSLFDTSVLDVNVNINAVLQALEEVTNVRILQQPRVFTADNQEAQFFDGQDFPFLTNTQTTDQGTVNESTEYRPVGIFLNVRPRITAQRDIDLDVNLELSSIVPGQTQFGSAIVDRRTTTTRIVLRDQQTIVLSGILTDRESQITRKVPFFGDIPIIGELFKSRENSKTTTELIAFITPHVVDNPDALAEFSETDTQRLDEISKPLDQQDPDANSTESIRKRLLPPDVRRKEDELYEVEKTEPKADT